MRPDMEGGAGTTIATNPDGIYARMVKGEQGRRLRRNQGGIKRLLLCQGSSQGGSSYRVGRGASAECMTVKRRGDCCKARGRRGAGGFKSAEGAGELANPLPQSVNPLHPPAAHGDTLPDASTQRRARKEGATERTKPQRGETFYCFRRLGRRGTNKRPTDAARQ